MWILKKEERERFFHVSSRVFLSSFKERKRNPLMRILN
jgi:hypothetical protein